MQGAILAFDQLISGNGQLEHLVTKTQREPAKSWARVVVDLWSLYRDLKRIIADHEAIARKYSMVDLEPTLIRPQLLSVAKSSESLGQSLDGFLAQLHGSPVSNSRLVAGVVDALKGARGQLEDYVDLWFAASDPALSAHIAQAEADLKGGNVFSLSDIASQ